MKKRKTQEQEKEKTNRMPYNTKIWKANLFNKIN